MFDLVSIGDCMVDNYFKIHDAHVDCSVDKKNCQLCLSYAQKIAVDQYTSMVAGNCTNVSIGATKLRLKTAFYTNVGSDLGGQKVIQKLKTEKVDARYVVTNQGMESNVAAIIDFQGERTDLVYHQLFRYNLPDLDQAKWIYFSSLSSSFVNSNIVAQLENFLERTGSKLVFNPGTYQLKAGVKKYPKILSLTTLLVLNLTEAQVVLETRESDIKKLLLGLFNLGPQMVVITDGQNGSFSFDGEDYYQLGLFPAKLVETTGAGDAYSSGALAGLFYGKSLTEAMRWGAANSASVVGYIGPQAGLLSYEDIQQKLKESFKITAQKF